MKIYIFQAGDEFIKVKLDRENKKLEMASSKSNYRFVPTLFWKLFGSSKMTLKGLRPPTEEDSREEMEEMEKLDDDDFEKRLTWDFAKIGYSLVKKD